MSLNQSCCYFDLEIDPQSGTLLRLGALLQNQLAEKNGLTLESESTEKLKYFSLNAQYILGHNIFHHDLKFLPKDPLSNQFFEPHQDLIDTLYLSGLLFAEKPYHKLVKDYQLLRSIPPDPLKDCQLVQTLFLNCLERYFSLTASRQNILYNLLRETREYKGFFNFTQVSYPQVLTSIHELFILIHTTYRSKICIQADFLSWIQQKPIALAFALALIDTSDRHSIIPPWILHAHPEVQDILSLLRNRPCFRPGCDYCSQVLEPKKALKNYFGYDDFRSYEGAKLQEEAVNAALVQESIITIFPTGGGKSLTFQLPALIQGESLRGLTVVISPLQSLMKDQVDVLKERFEILEVATLNGMQEMMERRLSIQDVESGLARLLYISPESLRSKTVLNLLKGRQISRFVIDEAHCFSTWGQSLRVDYLYIGPFIKMLQQLKGLSSPIPISCFTATAKQNVIADIQAYFKMHLNLELREISTRSQRKNLHFEVHQAESEAEKLSELRKMLDFLQGSAIVFVSTTKRADHLAESLSRYYPKQVHAYHSKMQTEEKMKIQDRFMQGDLKIIVATSAFGMGVDKDDVSLVVHYDIPDSLESYIQEAGRAGRNPNLEARCCLLYCETDLRTQFNLLNASRLSKKEISQIWSAIKRLQRKVFNISAMELSREAGWEEELNEMETRVKAAIAILEENEYVARGLNQSLLIFDYFNTLPVSDLNQRLDESALFRQPKDKEMAKRIFNHLLSRVATQTAQGKTGEAYSFDLLCEHLGIEKHDAVRVLNHMRQLGLVHSKMQDIATLKKGNSDETDSQRKYILIKDIETRILEILNYRQYVIPEMLISLKELNFKLSSDFQITRSSIEVLRRILRYWHLQGWIKMRRVQKETHEYKLKFLIKYEDLCQWIETRYERLDVIVDLLNQKSRASKENQVPYSLEELNQQLAGNLLSSPCSFHELDQLLRFLHEMEILKIESGLSVFHTRMQITKKEDNPKKQFTEQNYQQIKQYYIHKIEQIHIISSYAQKMLKNYESAMGFVEDYFVLPIQEFLQKYYPNKSDRLAIKRPMLASQFEAIFKALSPEQSRIMEDHENRHILVAAGPGSGKTRILVHKVASLLLLEDVKPTQFLMLTFSRPAAQEIKTRLRQLVGPMSAYLDVFTYHSYAFHLLEQPGELERAGSIVEEAVHALKNKTLMGQGVKHKSVLLVDEYQDISPQEFEFLQAIIENAEDIRLIVVGDDDQNIYAFRGSSVEYMQRFEMDYQAKVYYLQKNFRSRANLVDFNNQYLKCLPRRVKKEHHLVAHDASLGKIEIHNHCSEHLYQPLLESILNHQAEGTKAVLTATNEEALLMQTLLTQAGQPARLILSLPNFRLKNIVEIRLFSHSLFKSTPQELGLIQHESWNQAREYLAKMCEGSVNLGLAYEVISEFENTHPKLFLSDWLQYLDEIRIEDFANPEKGEIFVSTMHKAKGKEFDHVYLLLNHYDNHSDDRKRVLYVALTRAKETLIIHSNTRLFSEIHTENLIHITHTQNWPQPRQLRLQTGLGDIYLGHVKKQQTQIKKCPSGIPLQLKMDLPFSLMDQPGSFEILFSRPFQEKLRRIQSRGYRLSSAKLAWQVVWFDKKEQKEYRIPLPELVFESQSMV